jgi:hypothetical protein
MEHIVNAALLKIVGVFSYSPKSDISKFTSKGYYTMDLVELPLAFTNGKDQKQIKEAIDDTRAFYKNIYYAEFRDLMFTGRDQKDHEGFQKKQIKMFQRKKDLSGIFSAVGHKLEIPFSSKQQELFLFPEGIGIFSIAFDVKGKTLEQISDLSHSARFFNSKVSERPKEKDEFHHWVSEHVLCDIQIVGDNLEVDEYSGSKFKVYSIIDLQPSTAENSYDREALLFELGTSSKLGTIVHGGMNKPSDDFYRSVLQNKISAFANYDGLALLDSFTVVGTGNYSALSDDDMNYYSHHNWNRAYFAIYVFNLYVRYNLYKFNSQFLTNPVKYRNQFQDFLNNYNFSHISFNFLPNMIFSKMRSALGIDIEIEKFEKRLTSIAASVQEDQEKRQAFLLTLISVVSSFSAAKDILQSINNVQDWLGWSNALFYPAILVLSTVIGFILFYFLFPLMAKKFNRKWNKFWEKYAKIRMK